MGSDIAVEPVGDRQSLPFSESTLHTFFASVADIFWVERCIDGGLDIHFWAKDGVMGV